MSRFRSRFFATMFLFVVSPWAWAQEGPVRIAPHAIVDHRAERVGTLINDFSFQAVDGEQATLAKTMDNRPIVIAIRDAACPLSRRYGPRLAQLEARYGDRVAFLFVNPSEIDSVEVMQKDAERFGFDGPYVADAGGVIARQLRANRTTDVFVLDRSRTLRYRGAIDDQYGIGYQRESPKHRYLVQALDAVLSRKPVEFQATIAAGCVLPFAGASDTDAAIDLPLTYHERISRIMQQHCVSCHRDGGAAPFPLDTYRDVKGRRGMIRYVIEKGIMPPWHADPTNSHAFANDRSLCEGDQKAIFAWIEANTPEGDPANAVEPLVFSPEWQIGTPDDILAIDEMYHVPAEGAVDYKYTYVKTNYPEDRWIKAMELRPIHPDVVHHILVFIEAPPQPDEDRTDVRRRWQGGLRGYFAGLVPGQATTVYPEYMAKRLPAGAWLKFQIHYTPNGEKREDRPELGLVFADEPPARELHTASAMTTRFRIPPNEPNHKVVAEQRVGRPIWLYSFCPHMHLRGKAFRYEVTYPDGTAETLLDIPRYDFNWQTRYKLREPVYLPAGTVIRATAWYDNSASNPANPDPSATVTFGEQTWEEMMIGYFEYWRAETDEAAAAPPSVDE